MIVAFNLDRGDMEIIGSAFPFQARRTDA